jgi:hypothetical protein
VAGMTYFTEGDSRTTERVMSQRPEAVPVVSPGAWERFAANSLRWECATALLSELQGASPRRRLEQNELFTRVRMLVPEARGSHVWDAVRHLRKAGLVDRYVAARDERGNILRVHLKLERPSRAARVQKRFARSRTRRRQRQRAKQLARSMGAA